MHLIGYFQITSIAPGRWHVVNTLNGHEHVTYGTLEELEVEYRRQSRSWDRLKASSKMRGAAWRNGHVKTGA